MQNDRPGSSPRLVELKLVDLELKCPFCRHSLPHGGVARNVSSKPRTSPMKTIAQVCKTPALEVPLGWSLPEGYVCVGVDGKELAYQMCTEGNSHSGGEPVTRPVDAGVMGAPQPSCPRRRWAAPPRRRVGWSLARISSRRCSSMRT